MTEASLHRQLTCSDRAGEGTELKSTSQGGPQVEDGSKEATSQGGPQVEGGSGPESTQTRQPQPQIWQDRQPLLEIRDLSFYYHNSESSGFAWDDVDEPSRPVRATSPVSGSASSMQPARQPGPQPTPQPAPAIAPHADPTDLPERPVLKHIDLTLKRGEIGLLTGPSGCGKTTLLHLINGIIPEFYSGDITGEVLLDGSPVLSIPTDERSSQIGSIFQNPRSQFFNVHVRDEACFGCENLALEPDEIRQRVTPLVDRLGVRPYWTKRLFHLSGGQKQRVACLCVAAMHPVLMLYDEPSSNLDEDGMRDLAELMRDFKLRGITQLVCEHRLSYLNGLVDQVWVMQEGELKIQMTGAEFLDRSEAELSELGLRHLQLVEKRRTVHPLYLSMNADQSAHISKRDMATKALDPSRTPAADQPPQLQTTTQPSAADQPPPLQTTTQPPSADQLDLKISLQLRYKGEKQALLSCKDLKFSSGQIHALVGPNGLGKTSFLHALAGLMKQAKGHVEFNGTRYSLKKFQKHCALVFQDVNHQLITHSVEEELRLSLQQSGSPTSDAEDRLESMLDELGLKAHRDRHPMALSGGQKQRLALGSALLLDRPVLLLDEPTSGLDRAHMLTCARLLKKAAETRLVLLVTHDRELIDVLDPVIWEGC